MLQSSRTTLSRAAEHSGIGSTIRGKERKFGRLQAFAVDHANLVPGLNGNGAGSAAWYWMTLDPMGKKRQAGHENLAHRPGSLELS